MIELTYTSLDGIQKVLDLDSVIDVVRGPSQKRVGWQSLVTYLPSAKIFVELSDAPPDVRGNSQDEAEEVTVNYVRLTFSLTADQIDALMAAPEDWKFIQIKNQ